MKLFADASALTAIMLMESDARDLIKRIAAASQPLWSPMSQWETIAALCRAQAYTPAMARSDVDAFGHEYRFRLVPIGLDESSIAFEAYRRYGKGSGHAARLNMGDCFAYACARANGAGLLYKGDDFAHTDLA